MGIGKKACWLAGIVIFTMCSVAGGQGISFDDPLADQQTYLDRLNLGQAWNNIVQQQKIGKIVTAVLDSGFEISHSDLQQNLIPGVNIVTGSSDVSPVHPHGTGTIGIPGATAGNAVGITGSALSSNIMPIRISNRSDGAAYVFDIARAITYAADNGARVINISYSGVDNKTIAKAAKYARKRGAITFMAAGNSGQLTKWKNYKDLVAVGSIDANNNKSSFSTYGKFVDFVAPGEDVVTLYTEDGYAAWNGTSFSSPIASSVAALVLTANPLLSPRQVLKIMKRTATDLNQEGRDIQTGWGLPDADAAVQRALQTKGKMKRYFKKRGIDPYKINDVTEFALSDEQQDTFTTPQAAEQPAAQVESAASLLTLAGLEISGTTQAGLHGPAGGLLVPQGFLVGFDDALVGQPIGLSLNIAAVPEPGTMTLLLLAMYLILPQRKKIAVVATIRS